MRKKQSTNFIILSLQRHKPLYPQNISLKKKKKQTKKQIASWWPYTQTGLTEMYREQTKGGEEGAAKNV